MDTFKQYLPLCWLSAHPLDLPRSTRFFQYNLVFYFVLEFFIQLNMTDDFSSILDVVVETSLTLSFIAVALFFNKTLHSYVQIATAVLFCENFVAIFFVPIVVWITITEDTLSYLFLAVFAIWDLILIAYILKNVLAINMLAGTVMSIFYFIVTYGGSYALLSGLI